jgi:hypothetical protein
VDGTQIVDFTSDDKIPIVATVLGKALWQSVPSGLRNNFSSFPPAPTSAVVLDSLAPRPSFRCSAGDSVQIRTGTGGLLHGWISEESMDGALVVVISEAMSSGQSTQAPTTRTQQQQPQMSQTFVLPPPPPPPVPSLPSPPYGAGASLLDSIRPPSGAGSPYSPAAYGGAVPPTVSTAPVRLALGQDSSRLPRMNGLSAADFAVGEPVSVRRGDGRRTAGEVVDVTQPGVVKVRCGPDQFKTVPEQELGKLCGSYTL